MPNKTAVALGRLRMGGLTQEEKAEFAKSGGLARARALSKQRRSEIGKKAAAARWGKKAKD